MAGIIARVLSTVRRVRNGVSILDVKINTAGDVRTLEHLSPAGDDSNPLPEDYLGGSPVQGSGRGVVSGYVDPLNPGVTLPGEARRYSRDLAGAIQATLHLTRDGSIQLVSVPGGSSWTLDADGSVTSTNANGTLTLHADGSISGSSPGGAFDLSAAGDLTVNGAKISAAGEMINAAGVVLGTHLHGAGTYLGDGDPVSPGPLAGGFSGVPIPT